MKTDEALALDLLKGSGEATIRLYRWNPPAVSLGRHQREDDIDRAACARMGIDVVRRPTGGRAVLHWEELTYAVVMPDPGGGVSAAYASISRALVTGLSLYGADVDFVRTQPDLRAAGARVDGVSCFSSATRYEVEAGGRKLVGSAQRRYMSSDGRQVVLQHGSILCGRAHERLADLLSLSPDARMHVRRTLRNTTAVLEEITPPPVDYRRLADCLRRGFEQAWGAECDCADVPLEHYAT